MSKQQSRRQRKDAAAVVERDVLVIGAGFSGINAAISLRARGITDFLVLERAATPGGTWRDNVYPGCACDVPSVLYSYSFAPKPDWSSTFAGAGEINAYIQGCVDRFGLGGHLRFNIGIERADFDEAAGRWTLQDAHGRQYRARAVICATGGLVNPQEPAIAGRDTFAGPVVHTARWNPALDLHGKRVAVIGTGASAIQVVPAIQPNVASLTLYQRTAPWVIPRLENLTPPGLRRRFADHPWLQGLTRKAVFALTEGIFGPAVILDSPYSRAFEALARWNLRRGISDPALRRQVTPDYRLGCKRVLISNDYYPALAQANVEVCGDAIERIVSDGIATRDGTRRAHDVLILATGFRMDIGRAPFVVNGVGGESLAEVWSRPGGKAYRGVAVAGFPNWFLMLGPNTGPGHTSVLVYTEAQSRYIVEGIERLLSGPSRRIVVREEAQQRWNEKLQRRMRHTNWSTGCTSWYLDEHGENHALFPGLASEYVLGMRKFHAPDFRLY